MSIKQTEQKIQDLQNRVKTLAAKRDNIIRQAGSEEQRLKEAFIKLQELGIENPDKLSLEELKDLSTQLEEQLEETIAELTQKIVEGEQLLAGV